MPFWSADLQISTSFRGQWTRSQTLESDLWHEGSHFTSCSYCSSHPEMQVRFGPGRLFDPLRQGWFGPLVLDKGGGFFLQNQLLYGNFSEGNPSTAPFQAILVLTDLSTKPFEYWTVLKNDPFTSREVAKLNGNGKCLILCELAATNGSLTATELFSATDFN